MMDEEKNQKSIYNLKLNETLTIDNSCYYRRVPGGWIVTVLDKGEDALGNTMQFVMSSVFVPFNEEFNL